MPHPYTVLPATSYWRKSVTGRLAHDIDPILNGGFKIDPRMRVATAGSCFSQRISQQLQKSRYNFFRTEHAPADDAQNPFYGLFSAAYGNVYTTTQLRQLMCRAYGIIDPAINVWRNAKGRFLDAFRPGLNDEGFASEAEVLALQDHHLACVRRLFEETDVFVFTLGLSEAWTDAAGIVIPIIPGAIDAADYEPHYTFVNFSVTKIIGDLLAFVDDLKLVSRKVEVILTVSPVPIIATFEKRHVLVSNMYSKSALRTAAGEVAAARDFVHYFPSYEVVVGHQSRASFYDDDLRSVSTEGVRHVMDLFARHFLGSAQEHEPTAPPTAPVEPEQPIEPRATASAPVDRASLDKVLREYQEVAGVVCDEERLA